RPSSPPPRPTLFPYTTLFRSRAGNAAGDPGVDQRRDAGLDDEADVDTDGRAALVERGHAEVRMLAGADLAHLGGRRQRLRDAARSEEHTSELQSRVDLVCRLL